MTTFTRQDRQRAVKQTLASWALEKGAPEPDSEYLALLDGYVGGELTLAQLGALTDAKFGVNASSPAFAETKVALALNGLVAVEDLTDEEQEEYFDRFDALLSAPSALEDAFFKDRQERGLGVGMDDAGNIIYATPKLPESM